MKNSGFEEEAKHCSSLTVNQSPCCWDQVLLTNVYILVRQQQRAHCTVKPIIIHALTSTCACTLRGLGVDENTPHPSASMFRLVDKWLLVMLGPESRARYHRCGLFAYLLSSRRDAELILCAASTPRNTPSLFVSAARPLFKTPDERLFSFTVERSSDVLK